MKRALIFAHFDIDGIVDPYVKCYLSELRKYVHTLIFVSTSVSEGELEKIKSTCDIALNKKNVGYDFASWKYGLDFLENKIDFDEIIFANDSVYAPVNSLDYFFRASEKLDSQFWGATANLQVEEHIQSFFFGFRRKLVQSKLFSDFWNGVVDLENKDDIISQYEVGLTRKLTDHGYKIASVFDPKSIRAHRKIRAAFNDVRYRDQGILRRLVKSITKAESPKSPMHYFWDCVLDSGVPMIKVELLRDNPCRLNESAIWKYLESYPDFCIRIENHLCRINRNKQRRP
jgi:rhamnosyltransferase